MSKVRDLYQRAQTAYGRKADALATQWRRSAALHGGCPETEWLSQRPKRHGLNKITLIDRTPVQIAELQGDLRAARSQLASVTFPTITVWPGAALFKVHVPGEPLNTQRRGDVIGFSRASRRRVQERMAQIDRASRPPLFVTLTFPAEALRRAALSHQSRTARQAAQKEECNKARESLRTWWKAVRRRYPQASAIWRLEIQPSRARVRKEYAPHFHLLIFGVPFLPINAALNADWNLTDIWNRIIGSESPNSVDLEVIRSLDGAMAYASKYLAKEESIQETSEATGEQRREVVANLMTFGRVWGILERKNFPTVEPEELDLTYPQAIEIIDGIARIVEVATGRPVDPDRKPRSLITMDPEQIIPLLPMKNLLDHIILRFAKASKPEETTIKKQDNKKTNDDHLRTSTVYLQRANQGHT